MEKDFTDVTFSSCDSDLSNDKSFARSPIYYSCKQVSSIIGETESTIRFWCKSFENILNIEVVNTQRKYKKCDIENLLFIKKLLREDNMSIKQVTDYFRKHGIERYEGVINLEDPCEIKVIMRALEDKFDEKIEQMQHRILLKQQEMFETILESINQQQEKTTSEIIEKISQNNNIAIEHATSDFKTSLVKEVNLLGKDSRSTLELITEGINTISDDLIQIKLENQKIHDLQLKLEDRKKEYENKKGFFKKLFSK